MQQQGGFPKGSIRAAVAAIGDHYGTVADVSAAHRDDQRMKNDTYFRLAGASPRQRLDWRLYVELCREGGIHEFT